MENKYYIPDIEEFYVGFDFQVFIDAVKGWREFKIRDGKHLDFILGELKANRVRVKLLDREDIESLGWKDIEDNFFELFNNGLIHKILLVNANVWIYFKQNVGHEKIVDKTLFFGKIKNKSELQKIMIQLGIK